MSGSERCTAGSEDGLSAKLGVASDAPVAVPSRSQVGNDPDSGAVVFLLGAGASKDAGCLTVRELTDQFPEWSRQNKVSRSLLGAYTWLRDQLGTMPAVSNGSQGNKVGEIRLRAEHTKTHRARKIGRAHV